MLLSILIQDQKIQFMVILLYQLLQQLEPQLQLELVKEMHLGIKI